MENLITYFPSAIAEIICHQSNTTFIELLQNHYSDHYIDKLKDSQVFLQDLRKYYRQILLI